MSFDYKEYVEKLGGEILINLDKKLICEYLGFKFCAYKKTIRQGSFIFDGNFRSCIDKVDYFKYYMKINCKHENLIFDNSIFKGVKEKVRVDCKEHGELWVVVSSLIDKDSGCTHCYNKYKKPLVGNKGLDSFIIEANNKHDFKFDYSLSVYKNTMTRLKIICNEHGVFEQAPNEHLKALYGCPSCYGLYNSFKISDYSDMCKNGSNLYVVELMDCNERFYKIGISKNIEKRFAKYKRDGFAIGKNLIYFHKDAGLIFSMEDDLLAWFYEFKYLPKKKFKGYTECFSYVDFDHFINYSELIFKLVHDII